MKIKEGFMLREVAGNFVVVPVGKASSEFNGVITLNSTGAFLWKTLIKGSTFEELLKNIMDEYEIDIDTATNDIHKFLDKLHGENLIE